MKLTFTSAIILLSTSFISLTNGESVHRTKRAILLQMCPKDTTNEECNAFAKEASKDYKYCHTYTIHNSLITWASCGAIACVGNLKIKEEDLTKPYPYCCKTCIPK